MRILISISTFLFAFLAMAAPAQAQAGDFRLLVFGDSLSAGYRLPAQEAFYSQLERALTAKGYGNIKVVNASKSRETSAGGVSRLPQALKENPDAVLLELGINDALRQVPVATIQENLEKIIETFHANGVPVMLIGMQVPLPVTNAYHRDFSEMYTRLAGKYDLILYPFFMDGLFGTSGRMSASSAYLQADQAHPTAEGVAVMVKNILPTVERFFDKITNR